MTARTLIKTIKELNLKQLSQLELTKLLNKVDAERDWLISIIATSDIDDMSSEEYEQLIDESNELALLVLEIERAFWIKKWSWPIGHSGRKRFTTWQLFYKML